jgi:zeaxanthin glucosyltransferase
VSNILIGARPMAAHVMQTFRLADDLQRRGHRVTYALGSARLGRLIESQGFRFYHLDLTRNPGDSPPPGLLEKLLPEGAPDRRARQQARAACGALLDGSAHREMVEALAPDLVVFDSSAIKYALPLLARKIPTLMVSPTFPSEWDDGAPHTHSHFIPSPSRLSRYRCQFEWLRLRAFRHLKWKLGFSEYSDCRVVAEHYGLRYSQIFESGRLAVRARLPQLILCPPAFDFPRDAHPGRHFLDSGVWTGYRADAADSEFPWHRLRPDVPLVYCSFGTRLPEYGPFAAGARRLVAEIVKAFSAQSRFQLVAVVGSRFDLSSLGPVPDHVIVVNKWVPQIKVLRRAAVHITHGGFTSVRESIECEVPMVVVPFDADQPGNAARVVYHNLGVRLLPGSATGANLLELSGRVHDSPAYRESMGGMKAEFERQRAALTAADLIESFLPAKAREAGAA